MQLIKPMKQGAIYKVYEYMRRFYLNVGVLSAFYYDEGGELCTEQHLWERIGKEYGNLPLDYSMPKPRGEVLIRGHAYAPEGRTVTGREVWFKVGGLTRKLHVLGDRFWRNAGVMGKKPSDPEPFSKLAISWENAYGGPGYANNPLGKGYEPQEVEPGNKVHLLPNILDPKNHQVEPDQNNQPVCFDTIPYEWPQRMSLAGNYGGDWKQKHFPGFAPDIDWSMFNCAQPEQRLKEGFFRGDEDFELVGMHPQQEVIHGTLPGIKSRVFLNFTGEPAAKKGEENFVELGTQLDTITFFPDLKLGVICWRAVTEVYTEDMLEIGQILVAYEKMTDPQRSIEHYRKENDDRRFKPGRLPMALLNEAPLIPLGARSGFVEMMEESKKFALSPIFANAKRRVDNATKDISRLVDITGTRQQFEDAVAEVPLPPDLSPDRIHEADIEGYFAKLKDYSDKKMAEGQEQLQKLKTIVGDKVFTKPTPLFNGRESARTLGIFEQFRGKPGMEAYDRVPEPEVLQERFVELQDLTRLDERVNGYTKPKFSLREPEEQNLLRARLRDDLRNGHSLRDREFSACDFTGFDFSGADLRGIDLRSCILRNAVFEGADLRDAIFSHADLQGANCRGIQGKGCGLSGTDLRGSCFEDADLSDAGFGGALLSGGNFRGARFTNTQLIDADWSNGDFTGAHMNMVQAIKSDFRGAIFQNAKIELCNFLECPMDRCIFAQANLRQVSFVNQSAEGATFQKAKMHRVIFSNLSGGSMLGTDFSGADMEIVNFQDNDLRGVNFKLAKIIQCCFMNSDMRRTCLRGCDARESIFRRCNLEDADLSAANFANANFRLARLVMTDFSGSNLVQAELLRCQLGKTRLQTANLKRTIMQDWRPDEAHAADREPSE